MKKKLCWVLAVMFASVFLTLCGCNKAPKTAELSFSTGVNAEGLYDSSVFYRNDLAFNDAADPGAIFVDGYYYVFPTGAPIRCYRSKDFANWDFVGYAFEPDPASWAYGNFWAPDVIQSKADGKFYMYYNASTKGDIEGVANPGFYTDRLKLSVAVADQVEGPYKECKDADNNFVVFDIAASDKGKQLLADTSAKVFAALDANAFYDGDDLYLYFAKSRDVNFNGNDIFALKMASMTEPDYSTLKRLTRAGYVSPLDGAAKISYEPECDINEAPDMLKHTSVNADGAEVTKYYLSYSMYGYNDRRYAVGVAVADSPLGDFVKLDAKYNQPVLGIDTAFDHMSGTGHHKFVETEDDFFVIYHAHKQRETGGSKRAIAADRMVWTFNAELGYDILHSNGPSYSLQPLPVSAGGYKNLMADAAVTATNAVGGKSAELLKDGLVSVHPYDGGKDFVVGESGTDITITFSEEKSIRAIMVYNSYESFLAFSKLENIVFQSSEKQYRIAELVFPAAYYQADLSSMRPGGAAVAEFKEIKVKSITFSIKEKLYKQANADFVGIALSEISVLGK